MTLLRPHGLELDQAIPFVCLGSECPTTCCGPFHGTRALYGALRQSDLGKRIGELASGPPRDEVISVFTEIRLSTKDVISLQNAGFDRLIVRRGSPENPGHYMRLGEDGTCSALAKDGLCSIHPSRPTLCRAFPFYIDLFAGLSMVASCPGIGAGEQTVAELGAEIEAVAEMYAFWLKEIRGP